MLLLGEMSCPVQRLRHPWCAGDGGSYRCVSRSRPKTVPGLGFFTAGRLSGRGGRVDSGVGADVAAEFQLFADQTADFVGVADPWGRILYLNPAARKRLGVAD